MQEITIAMNINFKTPFFELCQFRNPMCSTTGRVYEANFFRAAIPAVSPSVERVVSRIWKNEKVSFTGRAALWNRVQFRWEGNPPLVSVNVFASTDKDLIDSAAERAL
ncbi:hypothetical protein CDAR_479071 [Caerostris darwini]|uniref:Uncharacterized protein n=1 Tax=Caerostris darwini TaxID=1538125 RepID=A0AAV4VJF7_9ARAC|nr:hypothetical protein CDAR_479071 [Caerostris darwini]